MPYRTATVYIEPDNCGGYLEAQAEFEGRTPRHDQGGTADEPRRI